MSKNMFYVYRTVFKCPFDKSSNNVAIYIHTGCHKYSVQCIFDTDNITKLFKSTRFILIEKLKCRKQ